MSTRPGISLLSLHFPPEPTGNAPYTGALAYGLSNLGHKVTANVGHPHYPEWKIRAGYGQWKRVELDRDVEVRRRLHFVPRPPRGLRRLVSEFSFGARLFFGRWGGAPVVVAASPSMFSTALVALRVHLTPGRPALIIWVQDIYTLGLAETGEGGGLVGSITKWTESRTLRAADRVVTIHDRFAEYVIHELGVSPERSAVIRNWTHLRPSAPLSGTESKSELAWPLDKVLAVHTGNMGAKQGLENIVDAARLADEANAPIHFILVGDGGERAGLEARALGIERLTFVDPLDDDDYRRALAAADILLVNEKPGVSEMAVPSKLTSYFDAGRPIVAATDTEGITATEISAAHAGIVVPAGHPQELLGAALSLGNDKDMSAKFGANGRAYRERVLDQSVAIERWSHLVAEAASERRKRR
ncbi:Glycosyl transferase, group 1 [Microbacterium sp. C448]|uniref:glycosyltransferase family 4 protein n=1 Tax=Microbacterium sp. C448 TaxID=1177594 RepID=UPI0003DE292C|nr:glycosyltransferase family 4 protein [Microbacterium sp. C448]CDJ99626.1 Glycosyl transferase, group 1 [Microbacterium sp. C448]